MNWHDYLQAIIAVFVITDPVGRPMFFAMLTRDMSDAERRQAARTVITAVAAILFGAALIGKELLEFMGINLGAFGLVGGLIVAAMGLEMLMGGQPSRAQGGDGSRQPPKPEDHLIVPFAMPFIAGPGAITIVITISARTEGWDSTLMALVAVATSVGAMMFTFTRLTDRLSRLSARAMDVITKFGGLLVATIGAQLALNGIVHFFHLKV